MDMKRLISVVLAALLACTLVACGSREETEQKIEAKGSLAETGEALGYDLLAYNTSGTTLQFDSTAVVDDDIGQVSYQNGKSVVTLRMTLNKEKAEGLAGFSNAGTAGAIDAPTDVFSKLSIQVVDNSDYFCEFSYTNCGCTCYLSLAETKTNLDLYSVLLIDYVNQLYNMDSIPSFVKAVDPSMELDEEAPELSQGEEAPSDSEKSEKQEDTTPEPEPDEEKTEQTQEKQEEKAEEEPAEEKQEEKTEEEPAEEKQEEKTEEEPAEEKQEEKAEEKQEEKKEETKEEKKSEEKQEEKSEEKTEKSEEKAEKSEKKDEKKEESKSGTIGLTYYDITLVSVGDAYTFEPKGGSGGYTWKSADPKVATVSDSGTVTAAGKGQTKVTVKSGDGLSAEIIVRVPGK
jgi:hypothetical protein